MPTEQTNPILSFLPLIFMFVVFYFLLIRPQQKKAKEQADMIKSLKKGDRVVTAGGIIGTVQTLQDDYLVLQVGDKDTKIEVLRSAIQDLRK
jgi:preprotein translocase subunit YajC